MRFLKKGFCEVFGEGGCGYVWRVFLRVVFGVVFGKVFEKGCLGSFWGGWLRRFSG